MKTKTVRRGRFALGLLIYILVFAILAGAALLVFRQYLAAYEESRLSTAVKNYLETCADGTLSYPWGLALGKLGADPDETGSRAWAQEMIRNATMREQVTSDSSEKIYRLYDENGNCFETVTFRQSGEADRWGFTRWKVADETVNLEPYTTSVSVVVPEDYTVEVGGEALDSGFIVEKDIPYEILKPFKDEIKTQPTMVRYQYGPILGAGKLTVLDSKGQEVPEELRTELHYLDNTPAADRARVQDFVERWLAAYLPYADDLGGGGMAYFWDVYQLIVPGGALEARIRQAQDGFEYGNVQKLEILSADMDCCTDLGAGRYFADFSYNIRTYGLHDPTEETYRMRLLIREENDALRAEQMYLS